MKKKLSVQDTETTLFQHNDLVGVVAIQAIEIHLLAADEGGSYTHEKFAFRLIPSCRQSKEQAQELL